MKPKTARRILSRNAHKIALHNLGMDKMKKSLIKSYKLAVKTLLSGGGNEN